ncbi:tetratricopeptide repeat protein [Undibacterium umbellatum]|uniref:Probable UDP-N-acetylglucosamine--peptide N-acetylglucosaminyltransferase SPINDLY n=1 Tax=Undibacterium umbellatum TaxID=2762300 RepID=A0ABR6Z7V3_9BURK|nr:tetratricopeptide repeat protein [Undibacterium umbellatum]MBC3907659.1 tetratricopeptide repeat protein [Undibacterium umbellatum]
MLNWLKKTFSKSQETPEPQQVSAPPKKPGPVLAADEPATVASNVATMPVFAGHHDAIAVAYEKLQLDPAENLPANILADKLYEKFLLPEAEAVYRIVLESEPESLETWINLGLCLDGQSRFAEAIACYRHVLARQPGNIIAHFNLGVSLSLEGKNHDAEQAYLHALELNPQFGHAHFNLAMLFQQRDDLSAATHHYEELLKLEPQHYYAYCNLGMIHAAQGRYLDAEPCFQHAIACQTEMTTADFFLVNLYQQQGKQQEAENVLKNLLTRQPANTAARDALLNLYLQSSRYAEAESIYRQMLVSLPQEAIIHYNLGVVLKEQGQVEAAKNCYLQALQLQPVFAQALGNLGLIFLDQGDLAQAESYYQRALEQDPKFALAYVNLAQIYKLNAQFSKAEASYRKALDLDKNNASYHSHLGQLFFEQQRYDDAQTCYQKALQLDPNSIVSLLELGQLHMTFNRATQARTCFDQAIKIKPDLAHAHNCLGVLYDDQGMIPEAVAAYRQALECQPDFSEAYGNLLFSLNYHPDLSAEEIFAAYQEYERRFVAHFYPQWHPHTNSKQPARRLKVGYVSPDMRRHPVQHFLEPLLAQHDKSQFEIYAYAELASEDAVSVRYRKHVDHWIPTRHLSDDAMAEKIRDDGIDILVDVAGHTGNNRLRVMARKPAPVSITWLGYAYTTGLTAIDYMLSDAIFAPPEANHLFAEQVWRVETPSLVYRPAEGMGMYNTLPALTNGYVTIGTLSRAVRINHKVIRVWASILQKLENSRLVIDSGNFKDEAMRKSMEDKFVALGIDRSRLQIGAHSPPWDVIRSIDIGLDCFPHNSGTTLFESLYLGIPFVTLASRPSMGRLGSSILSGLGRPEWIARTEEEYVDKVVSLASNLPELITIRAGLRMQMQNSPLMDEAGFCRKIENAYRSMWQVWCAKEN